MTMKKLFVTFQFGGARLEIGYAERLVLELAGMVNLPYRDFIIEAGKRYLPSADHKASLKDDMLLMKSKTEALLECGLLCVADDSFVESIFKLVERTKIAVNVYPFFQGPPKAGDVSLSPFGVNALHSALAASGRFASRDHWVEDDHIYELETWCGDSGVSIPTHGFGSTDSGRVLENRGPVVLDLNWADTVKGMESGSIRVVGPYFVSWCIISPSGVLRSKPLN